MRRLGTCLNNEKNTTSRIKTRQPVFSYLFLHGGRLKRLEERIYIELLRFNIFLLSYFPCRRVFTVLLNILKSVERV